MRNLTSFDSFIFDHNKKIKSTMDALDTFGNIIEREINKHNLSNRSLNELVEIEQDEIARNKQELQELNKNIFDLYFDDWRSALIVKQRRGEKNDETKKTRNRISRNRH